MKVVFGFDAALDASGNNKGGITLDLASPIDASSYASLEMDLKIAPGSAADSSGNSGYFQLVVRPTPFYDWNPQFAGNVSTNDGWRHIRVAPLVQPVNDINAFTIELYGGAGLTGPVTFYVDNLKFTTTNAPPPSPVMAVERPIRGLNLIPTSGQYQRQNIATVNSTGYSWVGRPEPVTYSVTIQNYPDKSHSGFQTHIFLVSGAPTDSGPDYSQPNVIFLDIQSQANGSAFAAFRYKINEPNGNTFLYGAGTLGGVSGTSPIGTWSMTFSEDTNVVVTAPGGATGRFTLPAAAAALFADPLTVYVGDQANSGGGVGQIAVIGRFQIQSGSASILDDNFLADSALDLATWRIVAGNAAGVQLVGSDAAFWLKWSTPDAGFTLQATSNVADRNSWGTLTWSVPVMGTSKRILVYSLTDTQDPAKTYEPWADYGSFRLQHP